MDSWKAYDVLMGHLVQLDKATKTVDAEQADLIARFNDTMCDSLKLASEPAGREMVVSATKTATASITAIANGQPRDVGLLTSALKMANFGADQIYARIKNA